MLKDPALLRDVLGQMREQVPDLLSAKIRAGFDDADDVVRIAQVVQEAGTDFIAVHPRRRCDFYDGVADWRIIATLAEELDIPVIGNGDVWYAADALRMEQETGCAAVMIGRPAMRNPWIFQQIADLRGGREPHAPSGQDVAEWLHGVSAVYGELFNKKWGPLGKLKELVRWIGRAVDDGGAFRRAALRSGSLDELLHLVDALAPLPSERIDLRADGHLALERSGSAGVAPVARSA